MNTQSAARTASRLHYANITFASPAYRGYIITFFFVLAFSLSAVLFPVSVAAQAKPRLGILPFSGGVGGDGETIATLFSFQPDIMAAFTVVPRTSAVNAIVAEQGFQSSGYTDSDTIASLGRMLNADYVVSGHIRRLGNRNLVITTVIHVETFEQLAGDYREYRTIEEVRTLLPDIARIIINASGRDTSALPNLAIAPFNIAKTGVNVQDAETLAQILAVEISNTGKYAVLPRTTTIQAAMKELEYQLSGATAEDEAKALGRAVNAKFVLNAEVRSLGTENMFTVSILHVEDGSLYAGGYRTYRAISDGIRLMKELASVLSLSEANQAQAQQVRQTKEPRQPKAARAPKEPRPPKEPKAPRQPKAVSLEADSASRFNSLGASLGTSFADPLLIVSLHGTYAPLRNLYVEFGCDIGFASVYDDVKSYYSLYPFAHAGYFKPLDAMSSLFIGGGIGYMLGNYTFDYGEDPVSVFAVDITAGINLWDMLNISYTMRTTFGSANHKVSAGYTYRF